jgi:hypothetical protein
MVSDDQPPSDVDSDISDELPLAFKQRSGSASKQSSGVSGSRKPGSSGAAATGQRKKLNTPNKQQQRSVKGPLSPGQPNGAVGSSSQGVLGIKRRVSHDGGGSSEAKRHAGSSADTAAAAAAGADSFKDAMLKKLLAKKSGGDAEAAAAAATPAAASSSAGGRRTPAAAHGSSIGRQSSLRPQQHQPRRVEGRLSETGSLQRTLSDHDVRQKATGHLLTGLQRAVQEARDKHALQQQEQQQQEQQQQEEANGQPQQPIAAGVPPLVLPDAQQLAETIEGELFKLCGEDSCCTPNRCRFALCYHVHPRKRQLSHVAAVQVITW